ncbi:hypothetical protein BBJ28_00008144 [Nothophytophthora sp. Chile5]|nr:hypothetical protein BBJ28_00008144 [Nothophytophthora sp. Chile5]
MRMMMLVARNGRRAAAAFRASPTSWGRVSTLLLPAREALPLPQFRPQGDGAFRPLLGRLFSSTGPDGLVVGTNKLSPAEGRDLVIAFRTRLDAAPKDAEVAMSVFTEIQQAGDDLKLSKNLVSTIIITLAKQKHVDESLRVIRYSWERGVRPNAAAYAIALKELSIAKQFEEVLQVYEAMRQDNCIGRHGVWNYKTALIAAIEVNQHEAAFDILSQMHESGVDATNAYLHVLGKACKAKHHSFVFEILDHMTDNGTDATIAYSSTLGAAFNSRQYAFVTEVLAHMLKSAVNPTANLYDLALKSCANMADVKTAVEIQRTMSERGLDMTESGLTSLLQCAMKKTQWELAQETMDTMRSQGFQLTTSIFSSTLMACERRKQWGKLVATYQNMPPDLQTELDAWNLKAVLRAHAHAKNEILKLRTVEIFTKHKEKCHTDEYTIALTALLETNQAEAMLALLEEMKTRGLPSTSAIRRLEVLANIRTGAVEEAEKMLEASEKRTPDVMDGYRELFRFYSEEREEPEKAEWLRKLLDEYDYEVEPTTTS